MRAFPPANSERTVIARAGCCFGAAVLKRPYWLPLGYLIALAVRGVQTSVSTEPEGFYRAAWAQASTLLRRAAQQGPERHWYRALTQLVSRPAAWVQADVLVACSTAGGRPSPELRAAMTAARCARGAGGVRTHISVVG